MPEAWPSHAGGDLAAIYNQPMNITPSMSSLEALLSKLPSVVPASSSPAEANPHYCEVAPPHFVAVPPEKELTEEGDVEIKDVGECSSSMSYGHHHQHFQHHDSNVSSCMTNNRY